MRAPVLVAPAETLPVTLEEAKLHLRVDGDEDDALITGLINGAVSHLDGYTGILGRCLVEQTWRMDFDAFARTMCLPIGPVAEVVSVTWRDASGQISTVNDDNYGLLPGAGGRTSLRFRNGYALPTGLHEDGAVSVTFKAGYTEVPAALKVAILLMVGHWYANRETVAEGSFSEVPFAANALIEPFRRSGI